MSAIKKKLLQSSFYADEAEAKKRLERRIAELSDYKEAELESMLRKRKAVRAAEKKVAEDLALYEYLEKHKEDAAKIFAAELEKAKFIHTGLHKPKAKVPATPAAADAPATPAHSAYRFPAEHKKMTKAKLQHIARELGLYDEGTRAELSRRISEHAYSTPASESGSTSAAAPTMTDFFGRR